MNTFEKEMVKCPYNQSHLVSKARFQFHITKCRKAAENPQENVEIITLIPCPFNANHRYLPSELQEHYKTCPDYGAVACQYATGQIEARPLPYNNINLPDTSENWDNEPLAETYDPTTHIVSGPIMRSLAGASKSERKQFRLKERRRRNQADNWEPAAQTQHLLPMSSVEKKGCDNQALRMPQGAALLPTNHLQLGRGCNPDKITMPVVSCGNTHAMATVAPAQVTTIPHSGVATFTSAMEGKVSQKSAVGNGVLSSDGSREERKTGWVVRGNANMPTANAVLPACFDETTFPTLQTKSRRNRSQKSSSNK